jgi:hypothetical protein
MILAAVPAQVRPAMQTEHMTVQVKARVSPPPHSYVSLLDGIFGDATRRSARGQNGADNHRRPPSDTRDADRAHSAKRHRKSTCRSQAKESPTEHMTVQVKARVSPPPHSYVSLLDGSLVMLLAAVPAELHQKQLLTNAFVAWKPPCGVYRSRRSRRTAN